LFAIIFGVLSAVGWGAADFAGGLASRENSPYRITLLLELAGLIPLVIIGLFFPQPIPPLRIWVLSAAGSLISIGALIVLYRALAAGQMSLAAPISGLLTAAIPVVFSAFSEGLPGMLTYIGLGLALLAIWLISKEEGSQPGRLNDLILPLISGIGFGLYFVLIHDASQEYTFWPLIIARLASITVLVTYALATRQPILPKHSLWLLVVFGGVMDAAANLFFIFGGQLGRLDVAAVLGSLYPAITVILAAIILKERLSRMQTVGILSAFFAIVLLAL
jgi:drug/metabolite transporter (DMT)-like permease